MISTNYIPEGTSRSDAFGAAKASIVSRHVQRVDESTCEGQLERVVDQINCPEVRTIVRTVLQDMMRLLECLDLIENHLRHVDKAEQTFAFFQLIYEEARALVEFIRTDALNCDKLPGNLADTLDGIGFALSHDLRRLFETDAETIPGKAAYVVLSKVHRAHHILRNCLQQSTVSLAIVFDPDLIGTRLFNNLDIRYRQSLQLCEDLMTLRELVEQVEKDCGDSAPSNLMVALERFRNESMEALMYSDWPQFESFCERIGVSTNGSLAPVLHQFQCYLEALLGQVRMRAVLVDDPALSFEDLDRPMSFKTTGPLSSLLGTQTQEAAINAFAFAG